MSTKDLTVAAMLLASLTFADVAHPAETVARQDRIPQLTPEQVMNARREFNVEIVSFDASKPYGSKFPYSDHVKLRITNNSRLTLPYITPLTKRYSHGAAIGWSRAPAIAVHDLKPGDSKTIDYYPHGHISAVSIDRLTVEIERTTDEEEMRFFKELEPGRAQGGGAMPSEGPLSSTVLPSGSER